MLRFGLRTLLIVVAVLAATLAALSPVWDSYRREARKRAQLEETLEIFDPVSIPLPSGLPR